VLNILRNNQYSTLNIQVKKRAFLGTGTPLTIACHMKKKTYFFRESALALIVSVAAFAVESITDFALSTVAVTAESTAATAESTLESVDSAALLQATKAALTAKTNKSFFMRMSFCFINE